MTTRNRGKVQRGVYSSNWDDDDDDNEEDGVYSYAAYVPPVFNLPGNRVTFDNQSLSGKQLHAHCRKHGISLSIPEGVKGFVTVDASVVAASGVIKTSHSPRKIK